MESEASSNPHPETDTSTEFWEFLDEVPPVDALLEGHHYNTSEQAEDMENFLRGNLFKPGGTPSLGVKEGEDNYPQEKLEKIVYMIRAAKRIEVENASILAKNSAKKDMESALQTLKNKYEDEITEIKSNYDDLKTLLYRKDKEIERHDRLLHDQELLITYLRLSHSLHGGLRRQGKAEKDPDTEELRLEVKALMKQVESYKDMCKLYMDEAEVAKRKFQEMDKMQKDIIQSYEDRLEDCRRKASEREAQLQQDKQILREKFEDYKVEVEKELNIRELVADRQNKYISSLQTELKSAKIVIKSPRLKHKMLDKLKEYEVELNSEESNSELSKPLSKHKNSRRSPGVDRDSSYSRQHRSKDMTPSDLSHHRKVSVDKPREKKPARNSGYRASSTQPMHMLPQINKTLDLGLERVPT